MTTWVLAFLGFTAFGLLNFGYRYLDDLAHNYRHTFVLRMLEEMSGGYAGLALFPFAVWLIRRTRIRRRNWARAVPLNLLAMAGFSVCDTTLMSLSRRLLSPVLGLGQYDYGVMLYRYPMELVKHILLYWTAVTAIYLVDSYQEASRRQVATAELEARLAEAQLQNLRLQLQPHFLFNALNTISSVMHEDADRADAMLAQLSDLLRCTLRAGHSQEVPLEEELGLVKSYLAIMQARFGDDLAVHFVVDGTMCQALVPQLILQPLVENSIRHARDPQKSKLDICISARQENGNLLLQVRDNGPGIPGLDNGNWEKGIGLSNTEERLEGLYGPNHRLVLDNAAGLTVTIRLPLRTGANN